MSAAKKGKFTDAQRAATAATHERWKAEGHPLSGRPKSPEAVEKMRRARKGQYTEAQRAAHEDLFARWKSEGYWPTKGWSPSAETREKIRQAQLETMPSKLKRHGITPEEYFAQKAAGNKWCWFGRHFVAAECLDIHGTKACPECRPHAQRKSDLHKNYRVTPEWYAATLVEQNGKCAICGSEDPRAIRVKKFMIDHAHDETKQVRGLLCHPCNLALGIVEQTPNWTALAQAYLDKHKCSTTIQQKTS